MDEGGSRVGSEARVKRAAAGAKSSRSTADRRGQEAARRHPTVAVGRKSATAPSRKSATAPSRESATAPSRESPKLQGGALVRRSAREAASTVLRKPSSTLGRNPSVVDVGEQAGSPSCRTSAAGQAPPVPSQGGFDTRDDLIRHRIIRAAADAYRERGYEGTGMSDIARRVGMTAPALYWYFRSKEAILFAFLEHTIADLNAFVRALVRSDDPVTRLWEFVHAYVLWQLQQKDMSAAYERIFALGHLRNSLPEPERSRIRALEREFYEMCLGVVARAAPRDRLGRPELRAAAFALIGAVEHLINWYRPRGALSIAQLAELYASMAVAMIAAEAPSAGSARRGGD